MSEGLPIRKVTVGKDEKGKDLVYEFRLISGLKAFQSLCKLTAKTSTIIPSMMTQKDNEVNATITYLLTENIDELLDTFIDRNQLKCNGQLVDFESHFSGRCMDIPKLLYKVILENDKDFFHSFPTLMEGLLKKINTKLQANSLEMPESVNSVVSKVVNTMKENLG